MEPITKAQLSCINAITAKLSIDKEMKAGLVKGFSAGRCTSSTELNIGEAREMIQHLKSLQPGEAAAAKMRNKIIRLAFEMGWSIPARPKAKADMARINEWLLKTPAIKKKLDNYTLEELPKIVTQFTKVYEYYLSKF